MRHAALALVVLFLAAPAVAKKKSADGGKKGDPLMELAEPLFVKGNRWVMQAKEGGYKLIFKVDRTGGEQMWRSSTVVVKKVKGSAVPEGAWMPASLCFLQDPAGLHVLRGEEGQPCPGPDGFGKAAFTDPVAPYKRSAKPRSEGDIPKQESVTVKTEGANRVWTYSFQQDMGFTVALARDVGLVSYDEDLQDGGGTVTLLKFRPASDSSGDE